MASETTPFTENTRELTMEIERQYSYTTLARLIGSADSKPQSPVTPPPCGAVQMMKKVVSRLEEIDAESRELLQTLFSMLERDERLEKYVRKRLQDPKLSGMWELVEQILSSHRGSIDVDAMLNNNKISQSDGYESDLLLVDHKVRELNIGSETYDDAEMRLERFKIRTLDTPDLVVDE